MATFFAMPKLGLNMVEGRIISWMVKEGERVQAGQAVLEIETDKATNEVEAPVNGIFAKILHQAGENVPCNGVIAVILEEGESLPSFIPRMIGEDMAPKTELQSDKETDKGFSAVVEEEMRSDKRIIISPSAKKLAQELGVDISKVTPGGNQIKREDVERAYQALQGSTAAKKPEVVEVTIKPYAGMRKLTGEHMAQSVHTTARVALMLDAKVEKLIAEREAFKEKLGKVSINVLLAKRVAAVLKEFPYMNAKLVGEEIWEMHAINIGIAVDAERGLLVPVLRNADQKSIEVLHKEFTALSERALSGKASAQDLEGGTFTITNLGAQEIKNFVPVINLPECAILAVGAMMDKPVVIDGKMTIGKMMGLTLVFDHRIVDGAGAAKFLQRVKHLLEE